ncbi:hypothetical protein [Brevibacterium sp. UCMA 11752]|uniref:hypothetical protein n=1 Tax=Brevibacterium sp. UCMA 11752 TaxID=2745946 RepID=UPI001F37DB7F|nr:hypothetical protein [Brevibacterium sp. UCMA 11752]MCF2586473.1 hypothetical protein [Brevibacterium sp. UCMA 11752]
MFRILELVGLLAPAAGVVLLVIYRRRATVGAGWGIAGCVVALLASGVGIADTRLAAIGSLGGATFVEQLHGWTLGRFGLLTLAVALLLIGAAAGRKQTAHSTSHGVGSARPTASRTVTMLVITGLALSTIGIVMQFVPIDLGNDHEGLTEIIGLLMETVEFALIGAGVLALSFAIVTDRPRSDSLPDPDDWLKRSALGVHRLYRQFHERRG